jgi:hypothetical protein
VVGYEHTQLLGPAATADPVSGRALSPGRSRALAGLASPAPYPPRLGACRVPHGQQPTAEGNSAGA